MPLPTRVRTRLISSINALFGTIGDANGTKPPKPASNKAAVAWEYWLSHHLCDVAKGRYDNARKAAIEAGVLFDHNKSPRGVGDYEVYEDAAVSVSLTVRQGYEKLDADKFSTFLEAKGVDRKLIAEAAKFASSWTKPPHTFKVSLAVEPPE